MAHTFNILGSTNAAADVSVHQLDQSLFSLRSSQPHPTEKNRWDAIWATTPASPLDQPVTLQATYVTQGPGGRVKRASIALTEWAEELDDDSVRVGYAPIVARTSIDFPDSVPVEVADVNGLLAHLFGVSYNSLSSKVRDTVVTSKLMFGFVNDLW